MEKINVNIWDDYYDDGYVPEGEIQKTYAYVEEYPLSEEQQKSILENLFNYIKKNIDLSGVEIDLIYHDTKNDYKEDIVKKAIEAYGEKFFFKRYEITFKNLSHKKREKLVKDLNNSNIKYNEVPYIIYSES